MQFKDILKWNNRVSGVYALGVWTMIVSFGLLKYNGGLEVTPVKTKPEKEEEEEPNVTTYTSAHSKHVITYRKDFVPYQTRIYNFITSFTGDASAAKDSGNDSSDP